MTPTIRVIGLGNRLRGDDAAGLEVARRLGRRGATRLSVVEWERAPDGLLQQWEAERFVIVVDATCSAAVPGTVRRFDVTSEPLPVETRALSTHAFGLAETIELARRLDQMPGRLIVYGIEGACFDHGERISPEVEVSIDAVVDRIV